MPPETREATLRLVRALRTVFGDAVEDDRATPGGRYERALRSIGALERLRANDPELASFTPFRADMLDFFVREHTGRAPDRAGYQALLDHAAARIAADPEARLTDAVPSPALRITLTQLADAGEQMIRHVQSLPPQAAFTPAPRRVHPVGHGTGRPALPPDVRRRPRGHGPQGPPPRPRHHLEPEPAARRVGGDGQGDRPGHGRHRPRPARRVPPGGERRLRPGRPAPAGTQHPGRQLVRHARPRCIDWSTLHRPDGAAAHRLTPEWTGPGTPMPLLNVVEVDASGTPVLHLPGRAPVPVPENEFLALLDLAPALRTIPLGSPVLFLTTGPGALSPELVQRFSQRTGRPAHGYSAPMALTAPDPRAPLDIIVLPDPATNAPGHWTAATRQSTAATSGESRPSSGRRRRPTRSRTRPPCCGTTRGRRSDAI